MKKTMKLWLILSSFGIMFAILSWIQESKIIHQEIFSGPNKGVIALITGLILYQLLAKKTN